MPLLQRITYILISLIALGFLLSIASSVIVPLIYALLLSIFLLPLEKRIFRTIKFRLVSIPLSILVFLIPIFLISTFFSYKLVDISESLPSISENLSKGFDRLVFNLNKLVPIQDLEVSQLIESEKSKGISSSISVLLDGISTTSSLLTATGIAFIFAFFFLYYRKLIRNFIIFQFDKQSRTDIKSTIQNIKETIISYVGGLALVIVILSILNSIGLAVIGINYAIFWGVLAGCLAIIPFFGTLLGGLLPFLYALSTAQHDWQIISVAIYYIVIQQIEGNFITPKIVGNKVDINPMFAILSLIIFGKLWGVNGIFLALPMMSISKIILSQFESTESFAMLMSSNINSKEGVFKQMAEE